MKSPLGICLGFTEGRLLKKMDQPLASRNFLGVRMFSFPKPAVASRVLEW
jgi:hypothetical protein